MARVYSVSQINAYIKNMFASDFVLSSVRIEGEISNCKYHSSGSVYFTIKDEKAAISCILFASYRKNTSITLQEGMKVIATGGVHVYEKGGSYQLHVNHIEEAGRGALYQEFIRIKTELEEMGLFAPEYKKPLPKYAMHIGIVTASTGAAIQDIINVSKRRNPFVNLILYPSLVQGERAAQSIIQGIKALDQMNLDIIIIGRGGGSIEDLWAFNDEDLAKAIFDADTPIISAVGHEVDFTIADFVADVRAATPSAAAELANMDYMAFLQSLKSYEYTLENHFQQILNSHKNKLENYRLRIRQHSPQNRLREYRMHLDEVTNRLSIFMENKLHGNKQRFLYLIEKLKSASPLQKISSGYAYVAREEKRVVSVEQLQKEDNIHLHFQDGTVSAKVLEVKYGK